MEIRDLHDVYPWALPENVLDPLGVGLGAKPGDGKTPAKQRALSTRKKRLDSVVYYSLYNDS